MAYNEADENKKKECITLLKEKAKSKGGKLSYGEISEIIGNLDMDKLLFPSLDLCIRL